MLKAVYILFFIVCIQFIAVGQDFSVDSLLDEAVEIVSDNPEKSIELTKKAFKLASSESDMYNMIAAKNVMGYIGMITNDYDASYINYTEALEYMEKSNEVDLYGKYSILYNLAIIRSSYDDHVGAATLFKEAHKAIDSYINQNRELAEEDGDLQLLVDLPYEIAVELKLAGEYYEAGEILVDLWEDSEFKGDTVLLAKVVNELGLIKKKNNEFAKAGDFFSITAFNMNVDPALRSVALHNLANVYVKQEDFVKADKYFEEALKLKLEHSDEKSQFITLLDQGELSFIKGDNDQAIMKWETAVTTYEGIKNDPDLFIVYDWLQKAYRSTDLNKSIEYSDLYAANFKNWMTVQSSQEDSAPTLQAFNTRIDTILADRALKAERLALLRQYWPLGVVALLLIMLFVYVVQLSYNKRREKVLEASLKADRATVANEILNRIRRD